MSWHCCLKRGTENKPKISITWTGTKKLKDQPFGCLESAEELNLGPPNINPSSDRVEDLTPGAPHYKSSTLRLCASTQVGILIHARLSLIKKWWSFCVRSRMLRADRFVVKVKIPDPITKVDRNWKSAVICCMQWLVWQWSRLHCIFA